MYITSVGAASPRSSGGQVTTDAVTESGTACKIKHGPFWSPLVFV